MKDEDFLILWSDVIKWRLDYLKHLGLRNKMAQYLVRTNKDEKKTYILRVGTPAEIAGVIYSDFNLNLGNRDISTEDIVNPLSNKSSIAEK